MALMLDGRTSILDQLNNNGTAAPTEDATLHETFAAAVGQVMDTDLSVSRQIHEWHRHNFSKRNAQLDKYLANGDLPSVYKDVIGNAMDYPELALIAKNKYGLEIQTDDDIHDQIRADIQFNRKMSEDIFSRTPWYGKPIQWAGTMGGYMLDPINSVGMLVGLGPAAKGASYLTRLLSVAARDAAIMAGTEAVIQVPVYSWKRDIGLDHSISDSLRNIGWAAAGGAAFSGAAVTVGELMSQTGKYIRSNGIKRLLVDNPAAREAHDLLESRLLEIQDLDPSVNVAEHFKQVDEYITARDDAKPVFSERIETEATNPLEADAIDETYKATFNTGGMLDATKDLYEKLNAKLETQVLAEEIRAGRYVPTVDMEALYKRIDDIVKKNTENVKVPVTPVKEVVPMLEREKLIKKAPETEVPFVEDVRVEGNERKIVVGDAVTAVKEHTNKIDALERFKNCLKGGGV